MSRKAGSAEASRLGTCAAKALQCAGYAVPLRWHGRFAGAPRSGDATRRVRQGGRHTTAYHHTNAKEATA
ncbi:MAG: hypothetical protein A3H33_10670 [Betaproteobacteria bacterium RIFCSPLOWO2_02_FULL_65_20]|nr:MAG: hypothetical protein A3H33_10670 [Betaproteobacteria bacterium RIFCSPLOWO2_02_FULL_65_20]